MLCDLLMLFYVILCYVMLFASFFPFFLVDTTVFWVPEMVQNDPGLVCVCYFMQIASFLAPFFGRYDCVLGPGKGPKWTGG